MNIRTINKKDYSTILELDKKVYPTSFPVTKKIIQKWYVNNPEFGGIFEENGIIKGIIIAIPLNKNGWNALTQGELKEAEIEKNTLFNNLRDKELFIHIYHIEKLDKTIKQFHKLTLQYLNSIITNLKKENKLLEVNGFSGLCVTKEGINLFEKKFNCEEKDFIIQENILEKNGEKNVLESNSKKEINKKIQQGYKYINRCKMLVINKNEKSNLWEYIK
ncbi:MAG: hypothetical protein PHP82_01295 [Candidatus ainarchaeum sp.]|nr:hypothetical protein [Candidatus ainarchaeum sp.]